MTSIDWEIERIISIIRESLPPILKDGNRYHIRLRVKTDPDGGMDLKLDAEPRIIDEPEDLL